MSLVTTLHGPLGAFEDKLRQVPLIGNDLASAYLQAKATAEAELKRRLQPYFIAAFAIGGLGVVLGGIALLRTRRRH